MRINEATRTSAGRKYYKIGDDSMEEASFVMQRLPALRRAHLPGAELAEILDGLWYNLSIHSIRNDELHKL